jgi:hypothetical protein
MKKMECNVGYWIETWSREKKIVLEKLVNSKESMHFGLKYYTSVNFLALTVMVT